MTWGKPIMQAAQAKQKIIQQWREHLELSASCRFVQEQQMRAMMQAGSGNGTANFRMVAQRLPNGEIRLVLAAPEKAKQQGEKVVVPEEQGELVSFTMSPITDEGPLAHLGRLFEAEHDFDSDDERSAHDGDGEKGRAHLTSAEAGTVVEGGRGELGLERAAVAASSQ